MHRQASYDSESPTTWHNSRTTYSQVQPGVLSLPLWQNIEKCADNEQLGHLFCRNVALADFLTRQLAEATRHGHQASNSRDWSSAKGGDIAFDEPGQQVLQRSSVVIDGAGIEARFTIALPAQGTGTIQACIHECAHRVLGRKILGSSAADIFRYEVPKLAARLCYDAYDCHQLKSFIVSIEDQESLRHQIAEAGEMTFSHHGEACSSPNYGYPTLRTRTLRFRCKRCHPAARQREF